MNWYKKAQLNIKISQSAQEWWIDQSGRIIEADSEARDEDNHSTYDHNTRAIEEAQRIVKEKMLQHSVFSDAVDIVFGTMGNYDEFDPIASSENLNNWSDQMLQEGQLNQEQVDDVYGAISKAIGLSEELVTIAFGQGGGGHAKDYAVKNWKWIALRGNSLETYTLTTSDVSAIERGLEQAYGERVNYLMFDIAVRSNNTFYTGVSFDDIERGLMAIVKKKQAFYKD
jgi:hypothetical protein